MSTPEDSSISRAGRVRKKSTKLADFQSPDEISESTKQRRSSKKDGLSGSIFDPPEDTDSETDFGAEDLEMEVEQFDVKLEVYPFTLHNRHNICKFNRTVYIIDTADFLIQTWVDTLG